MVNWSHFSDLPGGPQHNFEMLCRSLVRLRYGRHGELAGLANQPGVEFHLHLHTDCDLGPKGRWFGWQCRWYDLPDNRTLGTTRRNKIEDALKKTAKHLPGLTDWVLCTRCQLAKNDQNWFFGLKKKLSLTVQIHLWYSADIEALLAGDAEILRSTYFGHLLFLPSTLAHQHELSVARIRRRWIPEAHQTVDAERTLRRMLGEATSWEQLVSVATRLIAEVNAIQNEPAAVIGSLALLTPPFVEAARTLAASLQEVHRLLEQGDLELLRSLLGNRVRTLSAAIPAVPRKMRGARLACGLYATNALANMRLAIRLLDDVDDSLGVTLVGVLADAGGGKTQLAAQLTAALPDRPAGILLHGRELHSGRTLDDLARSITIQGNPVPSMEALIAALDVAGQRARRRLPLVIDGLNEAENPMDWKAPLTSLNQLLRGYANVLVVCTVRTGARRPTEHEWAPQHAQETPARMDFAKQALPDDVPQIEIPDFGGDTMGAVLKYFQYFRINPGDAELPFDLLSHPLTLRIFCEVTNPDRKREVGIEAMPGSLTGLFGRYLDLAIERIGELAPRNHRYYEHDIRRVFDYIGTTLWSKATRELPEHEVRKDIGDETRPWNESIIHMLEQEGVILLMPGASPGLRTIVAVYDALGGYLIANAILSKHGSSTLQPWLSDPATLTALNGNVADCHPLALDIFRSLVGLLPRRLHSQQLWQMVEEPLKTTALRIAAFLEGSYLDGATVAAIADHIRQTRSGSEVLFFRLLRTRGAIGHPLNADFFDGVLRSLSVGERDVHWTEWIRQNYVETWERRRRIDIAEDVQASEERWKDNLNTRTAADRLRAKWLTWLLTTTARNLRDRVTRSLYWFGRGDPAGLFELAEGAADINDPYVFERVLAAAYGAAMAAHCDPGQREFRKVALPKHARRLFELMFSQDAPGRTTHVLTREYGRRLIELAAFHNRKLFTSQELALTRPPYPNGGRIAWPELEPQDGGPQGAPSPFRMDFANYTLGRLADGRPNYDFRHEGYRRIRAKVLWRVQQLGWTPDTFAPIDRLIESARHRFGRVVEEHLKIDRYGKKYSWIAYFELRGWLQDQGLLRKREDYGRNWDVDIDPSFPTRTPECKVVSADLLGRPQLTLAEWITKGPTPDLTTYFHLQDILGVRGPWVMLDGYVAQEDEPRGRRLFAFVRSFLVAKHEATAFIRRLENQPLGGRWLPEKPAMIYTFAGEMPWCTTVPNSGPTELCFEISEKKVIVKRKRPFYFLDGKPLDLSPIDLMRRKAFGFGPEGNCRNPPVLTDEDLARVVRQDRMVETEEVRKEVQRFRTLIPVIEFGWEGRTVENHSIHGISLAKELARSAGLVHLPQTHDLQTQDGTRATFGTAFRPEEFDNGERCFFIRENILRASLRKHEYALVWAVWGERELSYKQIERAGPDGDLAGLGHADFKAIYRL